MATIIINISKYIIIFMMILYTKSCYDLYKQGEEETKNEKLNKQIIYVYIMHFVSYLTISITRPEEMKTIIIFYGLQIFVATMYMYLYHYFYPFSSRIITNNLCCLLLIGYTMLTRLDISLAKKQFAIATFAIIFASIIPYIMDRNKSLRKYGHFYGIIGIVGLSSVFVLGVEKYGSLNWIQLGPVAVQPMEFVKIIFVFFIASMLSQSREFKQIMITTGLAFVHMGVLVLEKDLGGALIFFIIFIGMIYVGTGKIRYLLLYVLGAGALGSLAFFVLKDRLFGHVMVRVNAWRNPWADIGGQGYQIAQSLFAIGSGGYFGSGLTKGSPKIIPVSESDFIFAAISEEFGVIFGIMLILVCFNCFIGFIGISMRVRNRFYKTMAFGFAICYIFQTLLSIGGVTKFIPSTGVTIPLVSYGGSSVLSSIAMFAIMQGISTIENKEAKSIENERKEIERSAKEALEEIQKRQK